MGKRISVFSHTLNLVRESNQVYDLRTKIIRSPQDCRDMAVEVMNMENITNEHFIIATLNTKNEVTGFHTVFVGSLNASIVHPRETFQRAILANAASIVAFHNHPSGDPEPSREDIAVTKRLDEAGQLLGIQLLDHVIIGSNGRYTSLKEAGYL